MPRYGKMNAWDSLWRNVSHIVKIGFNGVDDDGTPVAEVLDQLSKTNLTVEQIDLLSRVVELSYKTGKEDALK